jgi:hypothetical protein
MDMVKHTIAKLLSIGPSQWRDRNFPDELTFERGQAYYYISPEGYKILLQAGTTYSDVSTLAKHSVGFVVLDLDGYEMCRKSFSDGYPHDPENLKHYQTLQNYWDDIEESREYLRVVRKEKLSEFLDRR